LKLFVPLFTRITKIVKTLSLKSVVSLSNMDLFAPTSGNFLQQIDATARTSVAGHAPQSGEYVAKHPGNLYLKERIVLQCKLI
jgi:hypothetical protein